MNDSSHALVVFSISAPAGLGHALTRLAGSTTQTCPLTLEVTELVNVDGGDLGVIPLASPVHLLRGDGRADGVVSIADALFLAQYLAGTRVACTTELTMLRLHSVNAASVRQDGDFDRKSIADALFIAQYLVGLRDDHFVLAP